MKAPLQIVPPVLTLTEDERGSPVWQSVRAQLERLLGQARVKNDNPKLTDVETATLRGHIACLTAMLALGKAPPPVTATNARPGPRVDLGAKYG